jgi:threonine synthase
MVTVQSTGCAPIVKAFHEGKDSAELWAGAKTVADGLRVPVAVGDFLMLRALRESGGTAVQIDDAEIVKQTSRLGAATGIFAAPEGGATLAAQLELIKSGWIEPNETVVLFITGSGHKYAHLW